MSDLAATGCGSCWLGFGGNGCLLLIILLLLRRRRRIRIRRSTDADATLSGSSCCFAAAAEAEEADSAETDADANPFLKQNEKVTAVSDHPAGQKLSPVMDKDTVFYFIGTKFLRTRLISARPFIYFIQMHNKINTSPRQLLPASCA